MSYKLIRKELLTLDLSEEESKVPMDQVPKILEIIHKYGWTFDEFLTEDDIEHSLLVDMVKEQQRRDLFDK